MRAVLKILIISIASLALAAGAVLAQERVRWEPGAPAVLFRHVPPEIGGRSGGGDALLLADLSGRLTTFARGDTALYAVYLPDRAHAHELAELLRRAPDRSRWLHAGTDPDLGRFLRASAVLQPVELGSNGALVLHADEGRIRGKDYVAVVNGAGEIVGARPVWSAAVPFAEAGSPATASAGEPATRRRR